MANKRNQPKPGSQWCGIPWEGSGADCGTFSDMVHNLKQQKKRGYVKINGPMAKRAAAALLYIQSKGDEGIHELGWVESDIIKKLIKDGSATRKRILFRAPRKGYTLIIATEFPEPVVERVAVPHARKQAELMDAGLHYPGRSRGKVRVDDTQTIKWSKKKDHQLTIKILNGTANKELAEQVGKTKTKMRKIRKIAK